MDQSEQRDKDRASDSSEDQQFLLGDPSSSMQIEPGEENLKIINKHRIKKRVTFNIRRPKYPVKPMRPASPQLFSSGRKVNEYNAKDLSKERSPWIYPKFAEAFSETLMKGAFNENIRQKELKAPLAKKQNVRGRVNNDLFNRLYVKVPPSSHLQLITDIDAGFFKTVSGRPFSESFSVRDYIQTIRDTLKTRVLIGYREDDIMLINQNLLNEQRVINTIKQNLQMYVNSFEDLLYRDHMTARQLLKVHGGLAGELLDIRKEHKRLLKKYSSMRASLYTSEERFNTSKIYQKFLFNLSPLFWKIENADQMKGVSSVIGVSGQEEEEMFGENRASLAERGANIDDMLIYVHEKIMNSPPPKLYFTEPEQLLEIYEYIQTQNMNYLLHAEELAGPLANIRNGMKLAAYLFDTEIEKLNQSIAELSSGIEWEEYRATELENMSISLIYKDFKELIVSEEVIKLQTYVEDVYESRIGPNDADLSGFAMMRAIEKKYRDEILALDQIPHEILAALQVSCYKEQVKIMKLAEHAAQQFIELDVFTRQLKKAFTPVFDKGRGKQPKNRSTLMVPPRKPPPPPRELTEQEDEHLEYFTDFCKFTDDPKAYGIDKSQSISDFKKVLSVGVDKVFKPYIETGKSKYVTKVKGIAAVEALIMSNV